MKSFLSNREFINLRLPDIYIKELQKIANDLDLPRSRIYELILEDYLVNNRSKVSALMKSIAKHNDDSDIESQPIKDAVLIAGGIGSRLQPFTNEIVKPLIPVQGKPVAEYLVELFRHFGVKNIYFSVCYKPEQIKAYFGDGSRYGMNFYYLNEDKPMGTAYAMRLLKKYNLKKPFFMTNADELKDINLKDFYEFYKNSNSLAAIALTKVDDPSQYGVARMDGDYIAEFVEKPPRNKAPSKLINSGLYIMSPKIMDMVPAKFTMTEKHIFPKLASMGKLSGYHFKGQWFDTGTPERYENAINGWQGFSWLKK